MTIIARTNAGTEFLYQANTAHKASKACAEKIAETLNRISWNIKPGQIWHVYEAYPASLAYEYANAQEFKIYRGTIRRKTAPGF